MFYYTKYTTIALALFVSSSLCRHIDDASHEPEGDCGSPGNYLAVPAGDCSDDNSRDVFVNTLGMKFVSVPPGEFLMGAPESDELAEWIERPQRKVKIEKGFRVGIHEVTIGQFGQFVKEEGYVCERKRVGLPSYGWNSDKFDFERDAKYDWNTPGYEVEESMPVTLVTWNDAVAFCDWLSKKEGRRYRLPTEREWEYFARAGAKTRFSNGDDVRHALEVGNFADADMMRAIKGDASDWDASLSADGYAFAMPVGRKQPNAWGIFDVHGNAWEWCQDDSFGDARTFRLSHFRVIRGGSWMSSVKRGRNSHRREFDSRSVFPDQGFRVVLEE